MWVYMYFGQFYMFASQFCTVSVILQLLLNTLFHATNESTYNIKIRGFNNISRNIVKQLTKYSEDKSIGEMSVE